MISDGAGLGDIYGATLERIKAQDEEKVKLAMATLTWACHSKRPLQVDELCHALAVEIGETDFDPENIASIDMLLDCCQGLITVDAEASTVRLVHYTVQEYLCTYSGLFSRPHSILAETCLTYLNSHQVKNLTYYSLPPPQSRLFLKYSARHWGTHANKDLSDHARTLALELLNEYQDHISAVSLLEQVLDPSFIRAIPTSPLFSGLHCASFFGAVELVTVLISNEGCEVDQEDLTGSTPLTWAARKGREGVVKLLLERGNVDPNHRGINGETPLEWAAIYGHEGVVKLLLEQKNVDPNLPDGGGLTPLGSAAMRGHEGVVKYLLEREDIDPNHPDMNGGTPLRDAAVYGHERVVKLLLEREDINPNHPDEYDAIPLWYAAIGGHEGVVKLLLEREDIDPNCPDIDNRTPLANAAFNGYEGIVRLLLEWGNVDLNHTEANGETPLQWAAINGHEGVVKLLLEQENVDPNLPDGGGVTPLGSAARRGHEGVV